MQGKRKFTKYLRKEFTEIMFGVQQHLLLSKGVHAKDKKKVGMRILLFASGELENTSIN